MPTYEYACKSCGEHLEVVQSFKDDPLTTCPACGGELRKVFGAIGIAFKGSGFYKNDSRAASKGATRSRKDGDRADKADTGGKGDKADSKTDGGSTAPAKSDGSGGSTSGSKADTTSAPKPAPKSDPKAAASS